mmetsp:Transcript_32986/g.66171  ORF Transcript_32986/g.66171 Transcript_32986/m.66171 type:complete len:183 (-) Transcript_32986:48-596(-)
MNHAPLSRKFAVVLPLTFVGIILALVVVSSEFSLERVAGLDVKSIAQWSTIQFSHRVNGNQTALASESPASSVQREVKRCAREITGDDTPRHLEPEIRAKVLECASAFMPPMDTDGILRNASNQLMKSATTPEEVQDASNAIKEASSSGDEAIASSPTTGQSFKDDSSPHHGHSTGVGSAHD